MEKSTNTAKKPTNSSSPSSFELEHELRYRIPKSVFVNLVTSPYKPFTVADRDIIRQLWTYNDGISRSRIRETVDVNGTTTYTACTKYKLDKDNQLEFERPILPAEFASVRSLYPNTVFDEKIRFYILTKENPDHYFVVDLRALSDEVVIEIECARDTLVVIPKWITENALKK